MSAAEGKESLSARTLADYEGGSSTQLSDILGFYDHFLFLKFFYFLPDSINTFLFSASSLPSSVLGILAVIKQAFVNVFLKSLPSVGITAEWGGWIAVMGAESLAWRLGEKQWACGRGAVRRNSLRGARGREIGMV